MRAIRHISIIIAMFSCWSSFAADQDFYPRFLAAAHADTNGLITEVRYIKDSSLVGTNKETPKFANTVVALKELKVTGVIGSMHLGMSMEQVVACWGKPRGIWSRCGGGPRFVYTGSDVYFSPSSNCATEIIIHKPPIFEDAAATPTLSKLTGLLGEPESRERFYDGSTSELVYRTPQGALVLGCSGFSKDRLDYISLEQSDYLALKRAELQSFISRHSRTNTAYPLDGGIPIPSNQGPPTRRQ